jgi:hypothetical protein
MTQLADQVSIRTPGYAPGRYVVKGSIQTIPFTINHT